MPRLIITSIRWRLKNPSNIGNTTGKSLSDIKLVVPPNSDARGFELKSFSIDGNSSLEYSLEGVVFSVQLETPIQEGECVEIHFQYLLTLRLFGGVLGYTAQQANLSDWYPFVPPYDAESGWVIHQPAKLGEYLVYDCADFDLTLTLVDYQGIVIAASTEVVPVTYNVYIMTARNSRGITFSASGSVSGDHRSIWRNHGQGVCLQRR